ncbi:surface-adhesin E family protein [Wielerella bovis]|uniref:surface-adhesin E family protein n=1 Tax=Wielerella bovis TaxID=2917790 RepID=UPI00201852DE|nr:surface-adhesin E family protein [Wielerella bovis]ULJ60025.1 surface-adhesin E family protein [Wielerella bovis]
MRKQWFSGCLLALSGLVMAENVPEHLIQIGKSDNPTYYNLQSIKLNDSNPKVVQFDIIINVEDDEELRGTSMVGTHYVYCQDKIILDDAEGILKVYDQPFGQGKLALTIPITPKRVELNDDISLKSITAANACTQMKLSYGGNSVTLSDIRRWLSE